MTPTTTPTPTPSLVKTSLKGESFSLDFNLHGVTHVIEVEISPENKNKKHLKLQP